MPRPGTRPQAQGHHPVPFAFETKLLNFNNVNAHSVLEAWQTEGWGGFGEALPHSLPQECCERIFPTTQPLRLQQQMLLASKCPRWLRHRSEPKRHSWFLPCFRRVFLTQPCNGGFKIFQEATLRSPHGVAPTVSSDCKRGGRGRPGQEPNSLGRCYVNALGEKEWNKTKKIR